MTKTKQRWFNLRLYVDMLRQLKLIGLILAGACLVISLLPTIYYMVEGVSGSVVDAAEVTPALFAFLYIGGIGMVYVAFSYLNTRSGWAFYYSLPNKARTTYLSIIAAIATWIVGTVVVTVLTGTFAYSVCGMKVAPIFVPSLLAYFTVGTLLVASGATIAVCISGTRFSNLILTGLILFLPRLVLMLLGDVICLLAPNLTESALPMLVNPNYNIAALPLALLTNGLHFETPMLFASGYLYSLCLALVQFALGLWLYCRRRSETAGQSAPSRLCQHLYRCAIAVPILVFIAYIGINDWGSVIDFLDYDFSTVLIFVLLNALVYFVYELITTKRFKNLLTALPLFVVLTVGVPLLFNGVAEGSASLMLARQMDTADIRGVQIVTTDEFGYPSYTDLLVNDVVYENEEIIRRLNLYHTRTVSDIQNGYSAFSGMTSWNVTFSDGFSSFTRRVAMTKREQQELQALILDDPAYAAARRLLPEHEEITAVSITGMGMESFSREIWELWRSEVEAYSGSDYDVAISESPYDGALQFYVVGRYGTKRFGSYYPINAYTPKTLAAVIGEANKDDLEILEALIARLQRNEDEPSYGYIQLDVYDDEIRQTLNFDYQRYAYENGGVWTCYENGGKPQAASEEALAVLKRATEILPQASENIDPDAPLVLLRYYAQYSEQGSNNMTWKNYEGIVLLPVTEADLDILIPQFGK